MPNRAMKPIAAEMLKPYVSDDIYHAIYWHQDFQGAYYYEFLGRPGTLREKLFGRGAYLPESHPAHGYRDIEAVKTREAAGLAAAE